MIANHESPNESGPWEPDEDGAVDYEPDDSDDGLPSAVEERLFSLPGVVGVGVGQTEIGDEAIVVYLEVEAAAKGLPEEIGGLPIVWEVTGPIDAQDD